MTQLSGAEAISRKLTGLSEAIQKQLLPIIAQQLIASAKRRIDTQTDLTGSPFAARSKNTDEKMAQKKMLMGLKDLLSVVAVDETYGRTCTIGFDSPRTAAIANQQQAGILYNIRTRWQPEDGRGTFRSTRAYDPSDAASIRQAQRLIEFGYTVNGKVPSVQYITDHLMIQKAGFLVRLLNNEDNTGEDNDYYLPARSFLGITEQDKVEILELIVEELGYETMGFDMDYH